MVDPFILMLIQQTLKPIAMAIDIGTIVIVLIFLMIFIAIIATHIKVIPEYQRLVVFRLGKLIGVKGPGIAFLIPIIDRGVVVDLREFVIDIPPQTCITKDNAPVDIDLLIYMKIFDPIKAVTAVQNYVSAATGIAVTTLRAVVGDLQLDDVLAKRDYINSVLRAKLDEVTDRWGIKVTSVEIREIKPPKEVQEAMIKQMAAERNRRAMILEAEGHRQAEILKAEGRAKALEMVNEAAMKLSSKAILLQYLDTLRSIAQAPSTKIVLPIEMLTAISRWIQSISRGESEEHS